jgi:chromosomal replication initiation ATPase DnaA
LVNIFLKKFKGIKIEANSFENNNLRKLKVYENIILDNFDQNVDENLIYSLFNIIDQDNKYLIINSLIPINEIDFKLEDLKSRTKNCLVAKIDKPDDELMFALILKNFSDRQIAIDKKLINFIIKRVDRSYDKIFEFIYKIDEISLKKKKSIDFKIIKEALRV